MFIIGCCIIPHPHLISLFIPVYRHLLLFAPLSRLLTPPPPPPSQFPSIPTKVWKILIFEKKNYVQLKIKKYPCIKTLLIGILACECPPPPPPPASFFMSLKVRKMGCRVVDSDHLDSTPPPTTLDPPLKLKSTD